MQLLLSLILSLLFVFSLPVIIWIIFIISAIFLHFWYVLIAAAITNYIYNKIAKEELK